MIIIAWLIVVLMTPVDAAAGARNKTVIATTSIRHGWACQMPFQALQSSHWFGVLEEIER